MGDWHHGMMMDGTHSAADVSAHVDHALKHFYVEIEATDAQKTQIGPLVKQAVNDLLPLHSQLQTARTQAMQALTQTTVDRTSLEAARVAHLQLAEQASKRIVQLIGDVGDVLTPTQRKAWPITWSTCTACRIRDPLWLRRLAASTVHAYMVERILLVEDDPRLAEMLSEYLGQAGFRVTVAPLGAAALEHLSAAECDAIVLDLMLPDMDGLDVCRKVRTKSDTRCLC